MTNPNDAAFAKSAFYQTDTSEKGLTKREYFAAMAMQGILANGPTDKEGWDLSAEQTAQVAVNHAEALIEILNKQHKDGKETK